VFAQEHGLDVADLPESDAMRAEVQKAIDSVNAVVGPVEQIKRSRYSTMICPRRRAS